jgi:hypothetical protein
MIGPLTTRLGGFTYVLVVIDKFTKWIEYKPIATLSVDRVVTSSATSYTVLVFLTLSLQIWDPIFTRISSGTFVNVVPLKSNMFQWLTREPMARLSTLTI